MSAANEPEFPFRVVWHETGEVETYGSPKDLLCDLEEFDSGRPADRAEADVTDAKGRPVHLVVKIWSGTCEYRLADGVR